MKNDTPTFVPVHRLSPAARRFFKHRPAGEPSETWPAPLRVVLRLIMDAKDPPLQAPELRQLVRLLQSNAERAIVGHWRNAVPRLRRSDLLVVEDYAIDRDADLSDADIAAELASLETCAKQCMYDDVEEPTLYDPVRLPVRDEFGTCCHPDLPECGEGESILPLLFAQGFEGKVISGENDQGFPVDAIEVGHDAYLAAMRAWQPTTPAGEGWLLASVYDNENGPFALFVRPARRDRVPAMDKASPLQTVATAG